MRFKKGCTRSTSPATNARHKLHPPSTDAFARVGHQQELQNPIIVFAEPVITRKSIAYTHHRHLPNHHLRHAATEEQHLGCIEWRGRHGCFAVQNRERWCQCRSLSLRTSSQNHTDHLPGPQPPKIDGRSPCKGSVAGEHTDTQGRFTCSAQERHRLRQLHRLKVRRTDRRGALNRLLA